MHWIPLFYHRVRHFLQTFPTWFPNVFSIHDLSRMKAILFTLIRAFEFNLAVPQEDIIKKSAIVQRPFVKNDMKAGTQLPLLISVVKSA